jgi:hypothetical protein
VAHPRSGSVMRHILTLALMVALPTPGFAEGLPQCDSPAGQAVIRDGGVCALPSSPEAPAQTAGPNDAGRPLSTDRDLANDMLMRAGISRSQVEAMSAWADCADHAVHLFADQPEPARAVAEAAMASCVSEKARYMIAIGVANPQAMEEATTPGLLARVMAIRAARKKLREQHPETKPEIDKGRM